MRVRNTSDGNLTPGGRPSRRSEASTASGSPPADQPAERQTSPEVKQLMSQLHDLPDFRPEVVADIERRLEDGDLLTPEAAEAAAEAVIAELAELTAFLAESDDNRPA